MSEMKWINSKFRYNLLAQVVWNIPDADNFHSHRFEIDYKTTKLNYTKLWTSAIV